MQKLFCYTAFWVVVALTLFFVRPFNGIPLLTSSGSTTPVPAYVMPAVDNRLNQTTTQQKSAGPLTDREFDSLLAKSPWPTHLHGAVKEIARCESSWIPTARGPTDDHGLMQVRFKAHAEKVGTPSVLYDPLRNLEIAHGVFEEAKRGKWRHGFAPWHSSNHCHGLVPPKVAAKIHKQKTTRKIRIAQIP